MGRLHGIISDSPGATLIGVTGDYGTWREQEEDLKPLLGNVECVMSSMVLAPMVSAAFQDFEKILVLCEAAETVFLRSLPHAVDQECLVVKSIRNLQDYKSLQKHEPSPHFDEQLGIMIDRTIDEVNSDLSKGEGIRAIITAGVNLTILSAGLRAQYMMPVFDSILGVQLLLMGKAQDSRRDKPVGILCLDQPETTHLDKDQADQHFRRRQVAGLTLDTATEGMVAESLSRNIYSSITALQAIGVNGISGDCGFMAHYQCLARHLSKGTPVFMTALIMARTLSMLCCNKTERVLIISADDKTPRKTLAPGKDRITVCQSDQFLIQKIYAPDRVSAFLEGFLEREKAGQRPIKSILLEQTEMLPFANQIRKSTGLPVYDIVSLIDFFHMATREEAWTDRAVPPHNPDFWKSHFNRDGSLASDSRFSKRTSLIGATGRESVS